MIFAVFFKSLFIKDLNIKYRKTFFLVINVQGLSERSLGDILLRHFILHSLFTSLFSTQLGESDNKEFELMFEHIRNGNVVYAGDEFQYEETWPISKLMPKNLGAYYRYRYVSKF